MLTTATNSQLMWSDKQTYVFKKPDICLLIYIKFSTNFSNIISLILLISMTQTPDETTEPMYLNLKNGRDH